MRIILKRAGGSLAALAAAVVLAAGLGACSSSAKPSAASGAGGRIRIVAAENFWGSIAEQLAGSEADVTSLITSPATDPHDYEPTAQDAREIASAEYVIENGIGYDPWAQKLVDANPGFRRVLNVGTLLGLTEGDNPHQWYSPRAVQRFVERVTADLEALDPAHAAAYEQHKQSYEDTGLREYEALLRQINRQFAGTPVGVSESIAVPLVRTAGLDVITPEGFFDAISEGNEPSVSDKATVDDQIAQHRMKVFVYNSQNSTPDVQRLVDAARREHIPVTTVTETLEPAGTTFQAWQVRQLRELIAALQKATRK